MGIYQIELENFKSYGGKHTIGPFKSFQCVVGPNGAGKSNLMDAFAFVLGSQTKNLRTKKLQNLIHRTKDNPIDSTSTSTVTLHFEERENPDDTRSPIRRTTTFSRTILATGASDYRINGKKVSNEDYEKTLRSLGIIVKAKNCLAFDGDIQSIAVKDQMELTELFEQISGSIELKNEYDRLEREKKAAEEQLMSNFTKRRTVNEEQKQIKVQKEEAENFKEMAAEKDQIKVESILWNLLHNKKDLYATRKELNTFTKEIEKIKNKQNETTNKLKEKKKEQVQLVKEVNQYEKQISQIREEAISGRPEVVELKEKISHHETRLSQSKKKLSILETEEKSFTTKLNHLRESLNQVKKLEQDFEKEVETQGKLPDITLFDDQMQEYNHGKEMVFKRTSKEQQELETEKRLLKVDQTVKNNLENKKQELENRKNQLNDEKEQLNLRKKKMEEFITETTTAQKGYKKELQNLEKEEQQAKERQEELLQEQAEIEEKLREAKAEAMESERDVKFRELLESLQRLYPGVKGRLSDICKWSHQSYAVAVTVALSSHMNSIIVSDTRTAMDCVKTLKEKHAGVATFLPLDKIKSSPVPEELRMLGRTAKPLIDVLQFEEEFRNAIQYVCGNTIVTKTLEEAKELAFGTDRHKVVTQGGVLIQKSGLMSGGLSGIESRVKQWDQKRVEELKKNKTEVEKELLEHKTSIRSVEQQEKIKSQITGADNQLKFANTDKEVTNKKLKDITNQIQNVENLLKDLLPKITNVEKDIKNRQKLILEIDSKIQKVENEIFSKFCKDVKVKNIREYESDRLTLATKQNETRVRLSDQRSRLTNQIQYEETRDLSEDLENVRTSIAQDTETIKSLSKTLVESQKEDDQQKKKTEGIRQKLEELREILSVKETEIREIRKKLTEQTTEEGVIHSKITRMQDSIEQLKYKRHAIISECDVEQIKLPKLSEKSGSQKKEQKEKKVKKRKVESEEEEEEIEMEFEDEEEEEEQESLSISNEGKSKLAQTYKKDEDFVATLDFSSVKKKETNDPKMREKYINEFKIKLQQIESSLEDINPNMKAIDQFSTINEKLEKTSDTVQKSREAQNELEKKFNFIRNERKKRFERTFKTVETNIDKIYKELYSSRSAAAKVTLDNPDEPYNHGLEFTATPPAKSFREIQSLSGGEKTVAALALLFALRLDQPAPFFIMDELDQALDDQSVRTIVTFLKKKSLELQFVVISHKDTFFTQSDALVGICKDPVTSCSQALTVDLLTLGQGN